MPVLEEAPLHRAVGLQRKSYQLLRWLEEAFEEGFITPASVQKYADHAEVALDWLDEHYLNLPKRARPERAELPALARFFTTYLQSTFELEHDPGTDVFYAWVSYHYRLETRPRRQHFRQRAIQRRDRQRADGLRRTFARELAAKNSRSDAEADALLERPELRPTLSYGAYGQDLLRRVEGFAQGAATLELWRAFAWTAEGSPKKGFQLRTRDILDAQRRVADALLG